MLELRSVPGRVEIRDPVGILHVSYSLHRTAVAKIEFLAIFAIMPALQ